MTSQVSLTKPRKAARYNPWLHSFWQAVRESTVVAVLSFLVYLCMFGGTFLYMLAKAAQEQMPAADRALYYLFSPQLAMFLPAILLIAALIQGMLSFRFLFNKGTTNAWFSLGMTRSHLFWSRFLAGAVAMVIPIAAAMAVSLAMNLAVFHRDVGIIIMRWCQMTAGLCMQAFALYAIVAAVCSAVGTVVEGLGYSFIAACVPSAVLMGINALMLKFLFGFGVGAPQDWWSGFTPRLAADLASFNPLLFLYRFIIRYASDDGRIATQVSALPMLGWLAAGLLIAFLAHRLFKARRAEVAGVMGGSRPLGFTAIFVVALFAFSVPYMLSTKPFGIASLATGVQLLISGLAAAAVFFIMAFPLRLIGRPVWKGLLVLPVGLVALFAIVGVLASGCLGYSNYVPDAADVKSVTVSYNGVPAYVPKGGWGGASGFVTTVTFNSDVKLTDQKDIAVVAGLHRAYAGRGRLALNFDTSNPAAMVYNVRMNIVYKMKDGRTVTRLYQQADHELMMKMLAIDGLDGARKAFADYISAPATDVPLYNYMFRNGNIYLSSRFLDRIVPLTLDDAKRQELLGCLAGDVASQSVEDRYFPAKPEVCILGFGVEGMPSQGGLPDWSDRIYVTESFTRTIGFLNQNNLLDSIAAAKDVDYLEVQYLFNYMNYMSNVEDHFNLPLFINGRDNADSLKYERGLIRVDDPAQAASILKDCRSQYLSADEGYLVYIHFKGEPMASTAFLPLKEAPDFVKQAVK